MKITILDGYAVCTPHLSYVGRDQREAYLAQQFERVLAFANGNPVGLVNP